MENYEVVVNAISTLGVPITVMVYMFWKEKNLDVKLIESINQLNDNIKLLLDRTER